MKRGATMNRLCGIGVVYASLAFHCAGAQTNVGELLDAGGSAIAKVELSQVLPGTWDIPHTGRLTFKIDGSFVGGGPGGGTCSFDSASLARKGLSDHPWYGAIHHADRGGRARGA